MSDPLPLCRHYHPLRYAWGCGAGYRAPRDCGSCTKYDQSQPTASAEDQQRAQQWQKATHDRRPAP